jgi:hypothetical protein
MRKRTSQPTVFVIVLNWNLAQETIDAVESVLLGGYAEQRVVVVDNGSEDGSTTKLAQHFGSRVALLALPKNIGFAAGMNAGIRYALTQDADWILLLNNDTIVAPDMVEVLMDVVLRGSDAAVLAPAIFYYDRPTELWRLGDRNLRWLPVSRTLPAKALAEEKVSVDYVTGCAMLVRRDVFEQVGLLDENLFMYYEDADFCRRVGDAGYRLLAVPAARMWHKVGQSASKVQALTRYRATRNKVAFFRRYSHGPLKVLTDLYLLGDFLWTLLKDLSRGELRLVRYAWRGFRSGWRQGVSE